MHIYRTSCLVYYHSFIDSITMSKRRLDLSKTELRFLTNSNSNDSENSDSSVQVIMEVIDITMDKDNKMIQRKNRIKNRITHCLNMLDELDKEQQLVETDNDSVVCRRNR